MEWRFLYREIEGRIDAATWWRGLVPLAVLMAVMTVIWLALLPFANRGLDERQLLDPLAFLTYAYLLIYAAAILLASICFYFLSAKRWRDIGGSPALAGAPLLAALVTGAAHWLQPHAPEVLPYIVVNICDVALAAIVVWQFWALGSRQTKA